MDKINIKIDLNERIPALRIGGAWQRREGEIILLDFGEALALANFITSHMLHAGAESDGGGDG